MAAADILWLTALGDQFDYRNGSFEGLVFRHKGSRIPIYLMSSLLSFYPEFETFLQENNLHPRYDTGIERLCNEVWDEWCAVLYIVFDTPDELLLFNAVWYPLMETWSKSVEQNPHP